MSYVYNERELSNGQSSIDCKPCFATRSQPYELYLYRNFNLCVTLVK